MPKDKKTNQLILVSGATGHQGGAVLRQLRERGFPVRALTRDPNQPKARGLTGHGVEVAQGNFDDPTSLRRALEGAYGAYSVEDSRVGMEAEMRQGIEFANAAKRSDIRHFVYSSVGCADQRTGIPHFDSKFRIEEHIRGTGMRFTIVRPVFFMENWLGMRDGIDQGTLSLPLSPGTRLQMIAVEDIGRMVAIALERPGKWGGRTIEVAGDELSMTELAAAFTRVSGREVRYVQVPWQDFEAQAGPEMTKMYRWFEEFGYHVEIGAVRQENPSLMSFERWIQSAWHGATRTAG